MVVRPTVSPQFSIIVPTHNRFHLLQECVASVLSQTYSDWELIIVDDGSTDETTTLVFPDARISIIHQEKSERSEARNLGIEHAQGQFILFMDDDDYVLSDHLEIFSQAIESFGADVIYRTGYMRVDENLKSRVKGINYYPEKYRNPVNYAAFQMCGVWSLCIPAEFLVDEFFPVGFPHWQDTHLILRLFAKYKMKQLDGFTYIYRLHRNMGSRAQYSSEKLVERAHLNVAAITDLFQNYGDLLHPFLPTDTVQFLCAEKYLEYAQRARLLGYSGEAKQLFQMVPLKMRIRMGPAVARYWWYGFKNILR